jgi:SAM-dependent methyltransferase
MALAYTSGNRVVGVDIDRDALDRARARGLETVWADLNEPLPLEARAFDAVVVGELLEHLPIPEALLDQAVRLLKPSGLLVGSVPNSFRLKNRLRFLLGHPVEPDSTHLHRFSPDRLRAALMSRFEVVTIRFAASRFLRLSPRLFANTMLFVGERPLSNRRDSMRAPN